METGIGIIITKSISSDHRQLNGIKLALDQTKKLADDKIYPKTFATRTNFDVQL